jgi:hypothetical protein
MIIYLPEDGTLVQRQQVSIKRRKHLCTESKLVQRYIEHLLDNGRLMQGDTDICLRSINIQFYRVTEKECQDYKNLSIKIC